MISSSSTSWIRGGAFGRSPAPRRMMLLVLGQLFNMEDKFICCGKEEEKEEGNVDGSHASWLCCKNEHDDGVISLLRRSSSFRTANWLLSLLPYLLLELLENKFIMRERKSVD